MTGDDGLAMGMFWGGLLVASVPILFTLGVGIYLLRRFLRERRERGPPPPRSTEPERRMSR